MRFYGLALLAGAAVLGACGGGGETAKTGETAAAVPAPGAAPAPATSAVAKVPATGTTHEIKMVGDDKGYRFEPADITIKTGDAIKFVAVSGFPHNVAFDPATVPAESKAQLDANMDTKSAELQSPLMMNPNESYTVSFGGIKPGKIPYNCTPHLAMNMKGTITVQ